MVGENLMKRFNIFTIIFLGLLILSCETAPPAKPVAWMRTLDTHIKIEAGSKICLDVTGETIPLSGNEKLVEKRLEDYVSDLLSRRGYIISATDYDYKFNISYKTNMGSRIAINTEDSSYVSSIFTNSTSSVTGSSIFNMAITNVTMDVDRTADFLHNISVNILDKNNVLIWSGDTAWETSDLDILHNSYMVFMRLFVNLPKSTTVLANVPQVKEDRIIDYYNHYCRGKWFPSLSLPYNIRFDRLLESNQEENNKDSPIVTKLPNTISNGENLAAYIDLIMMSEMALPGGSLEEWKIDPLSDKLWMEAVLGGKYIIGNNDITKNILINLRKISGGNGYAVNNCRVVDDNEYSLFLEKMTQWQNVVNEYFVDYYNFYE